MFKSFKQYIANRDIRKSLPSHHRFASFVSFNTAKTVGILYTFDSETEKAVEDLIAYLSTKYISCRTVIYYPEKKMPEDFTMIPARQYFCKSAVNWYGKPIPSEILYFTEQEFDILIDFNLKKIPAEHYLSSLSVAHMKVGRTAYPDNPYDFVLSTKEQESPALFVEELKHYLLTIDMRKQDDK